MVLWIVAALSIAVTGIVWLARSEIRQASAMQDSAQGVATGRAAMVEVLQQLLAMKSVRIDRPERRVVHFEDVEFEVLVLPLNGWVDLNRAPLALLAALLEHGAHLNSEAARRLAGDIVARRSMALPQGTPALFDAVEDLMQLPGIDYEAYARLAPLVTVDSGGNGQVNAYAAPPAVLLALTHGNQAAANGFFAVREHGPGDLSGFDTALVTSGGSSALRIIARPVLASASPYTVVCDVVLLGQSTKAAPWNFLQCSYGTTATW
ncbi:type II secretion system protein GspK [Comamonas flocculans]|nr:type II secretion system protein GspK [Comamonas flocculans]